MTALKLSTQHQKVFDLLAAAHTPLSAYEILEHLRKKGVRSPPTVYRALEKLQELGLVHRVETLSAFVACRCVHQGRDHHDMSPFAICTACGQVQEIDDPALARALKKLGAGFLEQVQHKVFEISGLCSACVAKEKGAMSCSR